MDFKYVKLEVLLLVDYIVWLRDELSSLRIPTVGVYDNVISYSKTKGFWRPLEGSQPFNGSACEIS